MVEIILFLSAIFNFFLMWYGYKLLRKYAYASQNTTDMLDAIERYKKHLRGVYELETFYGDQTLQSLLDHSEDLVAYLVECENSFSLTEREFEQYVEETRTDSGYDYSQEEKETSQS